VIAIGALDLVVSNITEAASLLVDKMGFRIGTPTPADKPHALVLEQGGARIYLTSSSHRGTAEHEFVSRHGAGIWDLELFVTDLSETLARVLHAGGRVIEHNEKCGHAVVTLCDGVKHTLRSSCAQQEIGWSPSGIIGIDHVAICVGSSEFEQTVQKYSYAFSLEVSHHEYVATEKTAMNSKALCDPEGATKLVFLEPRPGSDKSQIEIFLESYDGAGVQHVAFAVTNIVDTAEWLRNRGIALLHVPHRYYADLTDRVGTLEVKLEDVQRANILVDRDGNGLLLQAFTKFLFERNTLFVELIQRDGATGFGSGNIKALFRAVERELTG
jgi:4-hydroxyphenylpyruvate dioxygenase